VNELNVANDNGTTAGAGVVGTSRPDAVVVVFGGALGVINADGATLGGLGALAGVDDSSPSLGVVVGSVSSVVSGELSMEPVLVLADTDVVPVVVFEFEDALVAPEFFDADSVASVSAFADPDVVSAFVGSASVVSVVFCGVPDDSVFGFVDSELAELLDASVVSACATPVPPASAAPTPNVTAPAPSQIRTRGWPPAMRRRRAAVRASFALARFRIRC
jgi:hypothetical protein